MKNPASLAAVILRKHSVCLTAAALWIRKRGDSWGVFREAGKSRLHLRRLRDRTRELLSGGMKASARGGARRGFNYAENVSRETFSIISRASLFTNNGEFGIIFDRSRENFILHQISNVVGFCHISSGLISLLYRV